LSACTLVGTKIAYPHPCNTCSRHWCFLFQHSEKRIGWKVESNSITTGRGLSCSWRCQCQLNNNTDFRIRQIVNDSWSVLIVTGTLPSWCRSCL
jgi:hypothetical protein